MSKSQEIGCVIGQGLRTIAAEIIDPVLHDAIMAAADAIDSLQKNYDASTEQFARLAALNQRLLDQAARRSQEMSEI